MYYVLAYPDNNNNNNNCAAVLTLKACIPRQPGTLPVIVIAAPQVGFSIHEAPRRTTRGRAERRRASCAVSSSGASDDDDGRSLPMTRPLDSA